MSRGRLIVVSVLFVSVLAGVFYTTVGTVRLPFLYEEKQQFPARPVSILNRDPFPGPDQLSREEVPPNDRDKELREVLKRQDVKPLAPARKFKTSKLRLGRWLFWEKELSGTRRLACGTCHDFTLGNSDGLSLSVGPGGTGDSLARRPESLHDFLPRNSIQLFNMTQPEIESMFWDGSIHKKDDGTIHTPAGDQVPDGLDELLSVQAIFPIVRNKEFRGDPGSKDIYGLENKLANQPDTAFRTIWSMVMDRLLQHETYRKYFVKAFPIDSSKDASIKHVGKAIAAFQEAAFTMRDSRWNRYLMGYNGALSERQKKGAMLFFGKANCSSCHAGRILSDQQPHNIGVPQLGPGKPPHEPYDLGAYAVTGNPEDKFAFKTPSLHNVAITGPWMHNGAYKSLEGTVRHHLNPEESLRNYNKQQLGRDIQKYHRSPNWEHQLEQFPMGPPGTQLIPTVKDDPESIQRVLSTLDPQLKEIPELTDREVDQLMYFLFSLTSPTYVMEEYENQSGKDQILTQRSRMKTSRTNLYNRSTVPDTTPSGLPPECQEQWCMKSREPEP